MLNFDQFNKKKEKEYEIVKSRSGLPMYVLDSPLTQDDDEDREVTVLTNLEIDEPKEKSVVQQVSDYITRHF